MPYNYANYSPSDYNAWRNAQMAQARQEELQARSAKALGATSESAKAELDRLRKDPHYLSANDSAKHKAVVSRVNELYAAMSGSE